MTAKPRPEEWVMGWVGYLRARDAYLCRVADLEVLEVLEVSAEYTLSSDAVRRDPDHPVPRFGPTQEQQP